jgi:hypothetical protein
MSKPKDVVSPLLQVVFPKHQIIQAESEGVSISPQGQKTIRDSTACVGSR